MNQKGFTPLLIFITVAIIIGAGVVAYGYFIVNKSIKPETKILKMENPLKQQTSLVGTPECPELDYTGCDTSQDWMTWKDDGVR